MKNIKFKIFQHIQCTNIWIRTKCKMCLYVKYTHLYNIATFKTYLSAKYTYLGNLAACRVYLYRKYTYMHNILIYTTQPHMQCACTYTILLWKKIYMWVILMCNTSTFTVHLHVDIYGTSRYIVQVNILKNACTCKILTEVQSNYPKKHSNFHAWRACTIQIQAQ